MSSAVTISGSAGAPRASYVCARPAWLPQFIPSFDGLRGIAIVAVLLYHCHPLLKGTFLEPFIIWGWTGVSLFFVLSGFLITGIILDSGNTPRFYENFFARRFLRIWPVYWLLLFLNYFFFPFVFSGYRWMLHQAAGAPWLFLIFYLQNLWPVKLPGAIGPTWSLAIEHQFYLLWTPVARQLAPRRLLWVAGAMFVASPLVRLYAHGHLTPTHTLTHLDGLAMGSMIAIGLRCFPWSKSVWRWIARGGLGIGAAGVVLMTHRGSAFTDTLLACGFGGMLLCALLGEAAEKTTLYCRGLRLRPLLYVGKVSYSLYACHILVFSVLWSYVDKPLHHYGMAGNWAIVVIRMAAAIGFSALLWHFFEQPILKLKRHFTFR